MKIKENLELDELIHSIRQPDKKAEKEAAARWLDLCKPLFSLGKLEEAVIRLAGIQRQGRPQIASKAIAIFAADNGVVKQGVTQAGQEVTAAVSYNFTRGLTTVNVMAQQSRADLFPVDVGINQADKIPGLIDRRIREGTNDIAKGPAMSTGEANKALWVGVEIATMLAQKGYDLLGTGEMGIGNTTTSSAVLAVLGNHDPLLVTGRGAGLSDEKLLHKQRIIAQAIALNQPDPQDPLDVLQKVGGLDLLALAGFFIGAAAAGKPVLIDGFISAVAALAAVRMAPLAGAYIFPSHLSAEPGARLAMEALGLKPWFDCGMCVGEGTGCCPAFDLWQQALAVFDHLATWEEAGVGAYEPLGGPVC